MSGGSENNISPEDDQVDRIRNSEEKAFEELFFKYYKSLCIFSMQFVRSPELAKDCVQEVFLKIWRQREDWEIHYSLKVYLYQAVRNQALNQVEKMKKRREYSASYFEENKYNLTGSSDAFSAQGLLIEKIWSIVDKMPERRRTVFELHRKHGLSYKEIAQVMDIAIKTVENHMGKALQDIRDTIDIPER